jgi:hypothetical protein
MTHVDAAGIQRNTPLALLLVFRVITVERKTATRESVLEKLNTIQTIVTRNSALVVIDIAQIRRTFEVNEIIAVMTSARQTRRTRHVGNKLK